MMRDAVEKDSAFLGGSGVLKGPFPENSACRSCPGSSSRQSVLWCLLFLSSLCGFGPFLSPPRAHAALVRTVGSPSPLAERENVQSVGSVESAYMGETIAGEESDDEGDDDGDDEGDDDDDGGADELPTVRLVLENLS